MSKELLVFMPVYNEEAAVGQVIEEWLPVIRQCTESFELLVLDDGSSDSTPKVLQKYVDKNPEVKISRHENCGHGQSCIKGYKYALEKDFLWCFQIDSDGQCDPKYFEQFWSRRQQHDIQFGQRYRREDGILRLWISKVVSLCVFMATRKWIKDANVPYRLIKTEKLNGLVDSVPKTFYLANIAVSYLLIKKYSIHWNKIVFRQRHAGEPKVKFLAFAKHGLKLFGQLIDLKP